MTQRPSAHDRAERPTRPHACDRRFSKGANSHAERRFAGVAVAAAEEEAQDSGRAVTTAVTKALRILAAFRDAGTVVGVSELARATELPKSTAFRLLHQLEASGYLERVGTDYRLDPMIFELGNSVPMCDPGGLRDIAEPILGDLFLQSRYVVHLGVPHGTDVLYVAKIQGSGITLPTKVGGRFSASCSALGKAMLPFGHGSAIELMLKEPLQARTRYSITAPGLFLRELEKIRKHGVAFDREEASLGLTCVAAPVLHRGRAVAAVSVSGPTGRFDPASLAARVQKAAHQIAVLYGRHIAELEAVDAQG